MMNIVFLLLVVASLLQGNCGTEQKGFIQIIEEVSEDEVQDETESIHTLEKRKVLDDSVLANALSGYDIVKADPFNLVEGGNVDVDPGIRQPIFKVHKNNVIHHSALNCKSEASVDVVTTVNQFHKVTGASSVEGSGFGFEKKGEIEVEKGPVSASMEWEVSASVGFSESKSSKSVESFFKHDKGAIALASAFCITDQVQLKSLDYSQPEFSDAFKAALEGLGQVSSKTQSAKLAEFRKFMRTFGTHYVEKAVLGAKIIWAQFYTEKARRKFTQKQMKECSSKSAQMNLFGWKASSSSNKCSSSDDSKLNSKGEYMSRKVINSYGSRVTDALNDWAQQDWTPMPVKRTLRPIYDLFTDRIIKNAGLNINAAALRQWFLPMYNNYCQIEGYNCGEKKGCGIDDDCDFEETCLDKGKGGYECLAPSKPKGYSRTSITQLYSTKTIGYYGTWGSQDICPVQRYVYGFQLKSERDQGKGDDTALNAVKLFCRGGGDVTSKTMHFGDWGSSRYCQGEDNPVVGFRIKIEALQGKGDDTAANSVDLYCKKGNYIYGDARTAWGSWSPLLKCSDGKAVVGLLTRVEGTAKDRDDTALNGVKLLCADYNP